MFVMTTLIPSVPQQLLFSRRGENSQAPKEKHAAQNDLGTHWHLQVQYHPYGERKHGDIQECPEYLPWHKQLAVVHTRHLLKRVPKMVDRCAVKDRGKEGQRKPCKRKAIKNVRDSSERSNWEYAPVKTQERDPDAGYCSDIDWSFYEQWVVQI